MTAVLENPQVREDLSSDEVAQRVSILKRFKELLSQQRDKFHEYLSVLDREKDDIESGSAEDLLTHVELEEKIVGNIFSIQKVIDPLEAMYKASFPQRESEVPNLKAALQDLQTEASTRSKRNKDLLSKRMSELRSEIKLMKGNPYAKRPSYTGENSASLIDIKG
ncbi:MAG: flagellar biosynthesis protein FlgN [Treponema sp.]|jgi:flagellar biosynthesis/type III secretory pathway chaperone|nr:flagellar biosynthesis protein FlgN [Treponema sp.]